MERIFLILDPSLSRDAAQMLQRVVQGLEVASHRTIHIMPIGAGAPPEHTIFQAVQDLQPNLILLPPDLYFQSSSLKTKLRGMRTTGTITATYWMEPKHAPWLRPETSAEPHAQDRECWLNASNLTNETAKSVFVSTVIALLSRETHSGIRPLMSSTPLHQWNWVPLRDSGTLSFSKDWEGWEQSASKFFRQGPWQSQWTRVRHAFLGAFLWMESRGESERRGAKTPPALAQCELHKDFFWLRIVSKGPAWPSIPAELGDWNGVLRNVASWIRLQRIHSTGLRELTIAVPFQAGQSQPTLWLGSLADGMLQKETMPDPSTFTPVGHTSEPPRPSAPEIAESKIAELERRLNEMRRGGVSTSQPLPAPDYDSILDVAEDIFSTLEDQQQALFLQRLWRRKKGGEAA